MCQSGFFFPTHFSEIWKKSWKTAKSRFQLLYTIGKTVSKFSKPFPTFLQKNRLELELSSSNPAFYLKNDRIVDVRWKLQSFAKKIGNQ